MGVVSLNTRNNVEETTWNMMASQSWLRVSRTVLTRDGAVKSPLQSQLTSWSVLHLHSRAKATLPCFKRLQKTSHTGIVGSNRLWDNELNLQSFSWVQRSFYSTGSEKVEDASKKAVKLGNTERIKKILKEYGTVAFVFHMSMSLCSVGMCYLLVKNRSKSSMLFHAGMSLCSVGMYIMVKNGLDVDKILMYFNIGTSATKKGTSTFAIAYILHKALLPIRATITVVSVPFIVRQLRARGWMKKPQAGSTS